MYKFKVKRLSIAQNQGVTLTIVNPDLSKTIETQIALRGAAVVSASGTVLAARDMHAHNTFNQPNAVMPRTLAIAVGGGLLNVTPRHYRPRSVQGRRSRALPTPLRGTV